MNSAAFGPTVFCGGGEYPLLRVLRLAVSPLRRVTFFKRQKGNPKGLLLRSALAGSGSFAPGLIRAQRLRFASLHLLPLCSTASNGRCAPTPGSIPPLSLPTSPVDQKHSSLRSLLSGAASPRAAALLCFCFCFCGSEPAREGGLPVDLFLADVLDSNCGSELAREGGLPTCFSLNAPDQTVGAGLPAKAACQPTCFSLNASDQTVGASLLAKAACQPTHSCLMYINPVGAGLPAKAA